MTPLRRNATIKAGPAADIPGPTNTKIAPPIIDATPIIIACERERLRTSPLELVSALIIEPSELYLNKSVNLHACVLFGKFRTSGKLELMNSQNLIN